jgi:peptidyl-prolyl isomerase E (cyclophilin E)
MSAANTKTTLYVGGLDELVTKDVFRAAFLPFGDIVDISIPFDNRTGKHRGFGFVEYEDPDDAQAAVDNMNHAELYGRVLKVNVSNKGIGKGQGLWADIDKYQEAGEGGEMNVGGDEGNRRGS